MFLLASPRRCVGDTTSLTSAPASCTRYSAWKTACRSSAQAASGAPCQARRRSACTSCQATGRPAEGAASDAGEAASSASEGPSCYTLNSATATASSACRALTGSQGASPTSGPACSQPSCQAFPCPAQGTACRSVEGPASSGSGSAPTVQACATACPGQDRNADEGSPSAAAFEGCRASSASSQGPAATGQGGTHSSAEGAGRGARA